jgi:hypothetical protein
MTSFRSLFWVILTLLSQPLAARAVVLEPSPEMTAALAEVFGSKTARHLIDLPAERFKGAPEYALTLATKVKEKEITLDEAKSRLLTVLNKLDQGATLENMPNPEFEVVGVMPVGESVANRMVPGAEAGASLVASAEKPAAPADSLKSDEAAKLDEPAEPVAPAVSSTASSEEAPAEEATAEPASTEQASAEQSPAEPTLSSPEAESSEQKPAAPAETSAAEPTLESSGNRDLSSMGG